ncbi:MAG: methionyl-tRNA formyltransferase [Flavobacteriales bacterium]|nr:methionyl-tRNA formyltransferase [Flavobacteriales bacterium]
MIDERIIFMGTPDFAVVSLQALQNADVNIVGVITAPDRRSGRGMKLQPSAVKQFALKNGLRILQPTNLKSEEFLEELRSLNATLQVVVAFRMLPEVVWNMPPKGTINLHASLLPHYRGAAPINWAVINGEKETGVSTFFLQHKIDTGNIIFQEKVAIGATETAGQLHDRLMKIGAQLMVKTVEAISNGENPNTPQSASNSELKEAPKIFKEDCRIDWSRTTDKVLNLIRGLSPYPAAFTVISNAKEEIQLKIFQARLCEEEMASSPSENILSNSKQLFIKCADGWLEILELQLAGKKRMSTKNFLLGFDVLDFEIS